MKLKRLVRKISYTYILEGHDVFFALDLTTFAASSVTRFTHHMIFLHKIYCLAHAIGFQDPVVSMTLKKCLITRLGCGT
jgi:hypothetical protein